MIKYCVYIHCFQTAMAKCVTLALLVIVMAASAQASYYAGGWGGGFGRYIDNFYVRYHLTLTFY